MSRPCSTSFLTTTLSSSHMQSLSTSSSPPCPKSVTAASFISIRLFDYACLNDKTYCLWTMLVSPTSACSGSKMVVDHPDYLEMRPPGPPIVPLPCPSPDVKLVSVSMLAPAPISNPHVTTLTFAQNVAQQATSPPPVGSDVRDFISDNLKQVSRFEGLSSCPSYVCHFWWGTDGALEPYLTLAMASEVLPPLPSVLDHECKNQVLQDSIKSNPHLFCIVTPICTSVLESLLIHHPNPDFILSVVHGFSDGFWP